MKFLERALQPNPQLKASPMPVTVHSHLHHFRRNDLLRAGNNLLSETRPQKTFRDHQNRIEARARYIPINRSNQPRSQPENNRSQTSLRTVMWDCCG